MRSRERNTETHTKTLDQYKEITRYRKRLKGHVETVIEEMWQRVAWNCKDQRVKGTLEATEYRTLILV
jgi:hypothetical protein